MKFYSEQLKTLFNTEEELLAAEKKELEEKNAREEKRKKMADERKIRAKEVSAAYKEALDATRKYNELRAKFVADYGSFHMTYSGDESDFIVKTIFDIFNII